MPRWLRCAPSRMVRTARTRIRTFIKSCESHGEFKPTKKRITKIIKANDLELISVQFFDFNKRKSRTTQTRSRTIETIDSELPETASNDPSLSSSQYQSKLSASSKVIIPRLPITRNAFVRTLPVSNIFS